jgi:hypothetical protein
VHALLIVAPLAHVDGAIIHRLFGSPANPQLRIVGEQERRSLVPEWLGRQGPDMMIGALPIDVRTGVCGPLQEFSAGART